MAMDPLTAILDIGGKVLDKVLPDKMSEAERLKISQEFTLAMLAETRKTDSAFRSFMLAYEGAAKDVPRPVAILRSSIRPCFTILVGYLDWLFFTAGTQWTPEQSGLLKAINIIVLGFWFGERALAKSGILDVLKPRVR